MCTEPAAEAPPPQLVESEFENIYRGGLWGTKGRGSGGGSSLQATRHMRRFLGEWMRANRTEILVDMPCGMMTWQEPMLRELWNTSSAGSGPPVRPRYLGFDVAPAVVQSAQGREFLTNSSAMVAVAQADMSDGEQFRSVVVPAIQKAVAAVGAAGRTTRPEEPGVPSPNDRGAGGEILVILTRDALQHIPNALVFSTLANLRELADSLGPEVSKDTTLMLGHYLTVSPQDNREVIMTGGYRSINLRAEPFVGIFGSPASRDGRVAAGPAIGYDVLEPEHGFPSKWLLVVGFVSQSNKACGGRNGYGRCGCHKVCI